MKFRSIILAMAVSSGISIGVQAADSVQGYADPGFDWNGFYAGLLLGGETDFGGSSYVDLGVAAGGLAYLTDNVVGGLEASAAYYTGSSTGYELDLTTRLGFATNNALIYARGGVGTDDSDAYFSYGGGVWFGAADNVTLRAEVFGNSYFGSGTVDWATAQVGVFYHLK